MTVADGAQSSKRRAELRWWLGLLGLFGVLVLATAAAICRPLHLPAVPPDRLAPLSLDGHQRVLVVAPHCDDEVLGAAGVIQAAVQRSLAVKVVVATNGDGFYFAAARQEHRVRPKAADFIRLGRLRQGETMAALKALGVTNRQVSFLGYPDRGLETLWAQRWTANRPFRSKYTRSVKSPYRRTFNPSAVYAGADLLADLRAVLQQDRPDLVLYPHPNDDHPDHQALAAFCRLALALEERADPTYRPVALAYLVHRSGFPELKGRRPSEPLAPPVALYRTNRQWVRWDLVATEVLRKGEALAQYRSQMSVGSRLLWSFVRRNEVFAHVDAAWLVSASVPDPLAPQTWRGDHGRLVNAVEIDPDRDSRTRRNIGGADFVSLHAVRNTDGAIVVCARVRTQVLHSVRYVLRTKVVYADGTVVDSSAAWPHGRQRVRLALAKGSCVADVLPTSPHGAPLFVLAGATSYALGGAAQDVQLDVLDRIAWQLLVPTHQEDAQVTALP